MGENTQLVKLSLDAVPEWDLSVTPPQLLLGLTVKSKDPNITLVQVTLPSASKPKVVHLQAKKDGTSSEGKATNVSDLQMQDLPHNRSWRCQAIVASGKPWTVKFTRKKDSSKSNNANEKSGEWTLSLRVRLDPKVTSVDLETSAVSDTSISLPKKTILVPPASQEGSAPPYTVDLYSSPNYLGDLSLGSKFKLMWKVEGIQQGTAKLFGPLPKSITGKKNRCLEIDENQVDAKGNKGIGEQELFVIGPATYMLQAFVDHEKVYGPGKTGNPVEIIRTLTVGLGVPTHGGRLSVLPQHPFPRGPIAMHMTAFEIESFELQVLGGKPLIDISDTVKTHNQRAGEKKEQNFSNVAFTLPFGPAENAKGDNASISTIQVKFNPPPGAPSIHAKFTSQSLNIEPPIRFWLDSATAPEGGRNNAYLAFTLSRPVEVPPGQTTGKGYEEYSLANGPVNGMAAGFFEVERQEKEKPSWEARSWVAIARGSGLELHVHQDTMSYRVNPGHHQAIDWLDRVMGYEKKAPKHWILGVGAAKDTQQNFHWLVVILKEGPKKINVYEFRLPLDRNDAKDKDGKRIHDPNYPVIEANFFEKNPGFTAANTIRVVPLGTRIFLIGDGAAASYDRQDSNRKSWKAREEKQLELVASGEWEIVGLPAKNANYLYALSKKRGMMLRFELKGDQLGAPHEVASAHDKVVMLRYFHAAQADRTASPRLKNDDVKLTRSNPIKALLVLDGALLARNEIPDKPRRLNTGAIYRDRAYDPRLDAWIRCGHPFYDVQTTPDVGFASSPDKLYCRDATGAVSYIPQVTRSNLGFLDGADIEPFGTPAIPVCSWRGYRLGASEKLERGQYLLSKDHRFRFGVAGDDEIAKKLATEGEVILRQVQPDAIKKNDRLLIHPLHLKAGVSTVCLNDRGELLLSGKSDKWRASKHGGEFSDKAEPSAYFSVDNHGLLAIEANGKCLWRYDPFNQSAIGAGRWLPPNDYLESANGKHELQYINGQLLLTKDQATNKTPVVIGGVKGKSHRVQLHDSGELVIYKAKGEPVWRSTDWGGIKDESSSKPYKDAKLVVENDGSVKVKSGSTVLWRSSQNYKGSMPAGEWLAIGEYIESDDGEFRLYYQNDGNLVLYEKKENATWDSTHDHLPHWTSRTEKQTNGRVSLHNLGKLTITNAAGFEVWSSTANGGTTASDQSTVPITARLVVTNRGICEVELTREKEPRIAYSSRWVQIKNDGRYLHVPNAQSGEDVHFNNNQGSWWEFIGNDRHSYFQLVGTNLVLDDKSNLLQSGRVRVLEDRDMTWNLQAVVSNTHWTHWAFYSNRAQQFMYDRDGEPYVRADGQDHASRSKWTIVGLLVPGVKRAKS